MVAVGAVCCTLCISARGGEVVCELDVGVAAQMIRRRNRRCRNFGGSESWVNFRCSADQIAEIAHILHELSQSTKAVGIAVVPGVHHVLLVLLSEW